MPDTGSSPMATRWRWCSAAAAAAAVTLALAACSPKAYARPSETERLDENELRVEADRVLRAECPRIMAGRPDVSGDATYALEVAADGNVETVTLRESFGDVTLDDRIGELLARTHLEPAVPKAGGLRVTAGFACGSNVAVITIQFADR